MYVKLLYLRKWRSILEYFSRRSIEMEIKGKVPIISTIATTAGTTCKVRKTHEIGVNENKQHMKSGWVRTNSTWNQAE